MPETNATTFEICEYLTASALRAAGVPFRSTRLDPDNRVVFIFENVDGLAERTYLEHQSGRLSLCSLGFVQAILLTKNDLFSKRRREGLG